MLRQVPIGLMLENANLHASLTEREVSNYDTKLGRSIVNCWGRSFSATVIEGGQSLASPDWISILFRGALHVAFCADGEVITLQAMRARTIDASP